MEVEPSSWLNCYNHHKRATFDNYMRPVVPPVPQQLPFLEAICWQTTDVKHFTPEQMLLWYERGWHYKDVLGEPSPEELAFIEQLVQRYGSLLPLDVSAGT